MPSRISLRSIRATHWVANAAVARNANDADSLCARGVAKLKKGDTAGGNADIAAATAIKPDISAVAAGYGITVDAAGANAAPRHN